MDFTSKKTIKNVLQSECDFFEVHRCHQCETQTQAPVHHRARVLDIVNSLPDQEKPNSIICKTIERPLAHCGRYGSKILQAKYNT